MTDAEFDLAALDVSECVKSFLTYCPAGSERSATQNAMDYVKGKHGEIPKDQYRKLCDTARAAYADLTKTPLRTFIRGGRRSQGKRK